MKKHILHIQSSPRGNASVSTLLGNKIIEKLLLENPGSSVEINNVLEKNYAAVNLHQVEAYFMPDDTQPPEHKAAVSESDHAVDELMQADIIVISIPTYNFMISAGLKEWIDLIVRARKTFSYETGIPKGLLSNRKVYLAIASMGIFSDGPLKTMDYAEPYLRFILGFIGLTDIVTYRIEGLGMPGIKETAIAKGLANVTKPY